MNPRGPSHVRRRAAILVGLVAGTIVLFALGFTYLGSLAILLILPIDLISIALWAIVERADRKPRTT